MAFGDVTGTDTSKLEARIVELEAELATTREAVDGQHAVGFRDAAVKYGTQLTKTRANAVAALMEAKIIALDIEITNLVNDGTSNNAQLGFMPHHTRCDNLADKFRKTDDAPVEDGG